MATPLDTWVLGYLAILQLAVAAWWWRGPWLPGTRAVVAGLFAYNGLVTGLVAWSGHTEASWAAPLAALLDPWTNVLLIAFAAIALGADRLRTYWQIGIWALAIMLTIPTWATRLQAVGIRVTHDAWFALNEASLAVAIGLGSVAMILHTRRAPAASLPWALALGALLSRYGDLSVAWANAAWVTLASPPTGWALVPIVYRAPLVLFVAMAMLAGALAAGRARESHRRHGLWLATLLASSGLFVGLARFGPDGILAPSGVPLLLTLAAVRPVGFWAAQRGIPGAGWTITPYGRGARLAAFAGAAITGAAAVWAARPLFATSGPGALVAGLAGAALFLAGLMIYRTVHGTAPALPDAPAFDVSWIDKERVPLPPDWQDQVRQAHAAFLALEPGVQGQLARMTRWQRILIALHGADARGQRTLAHGTPGIHLATHCPYNQIGPEIARTNRRTQVVLSEMGLDDLGNGTETPPHLVARSHGRVPGLRSARVSIYRLTDEGRAVAEVLARRMGIDQVPVAARAPLVGEGFGRPLARNPLPSNRR